jgi:predicted amidohydrolase
MKAGIAQLNSNDSVAENLKQMKNLIAESKHEKPDVIFFPENSLFFRIGAGSAVHAVKLEDPEIAELALLAREQRVALHLTTAVEEDGKVFNASILIEPTGEPRIVYRKMHLFDIELDGQRPIRESESFVHGPSPVVTDVAGFKTGHSICYDVRFAELYSSYARQKVDLILVPAAFLVKTGQAHWEVLLRARAIESQCYVIAAAQAGVHRSAVEGQKRETFGHSMLVDPWGQIVSVKSADVGIFYAELSKEEISKVRKQIPMDQHRRDVF